jgi:hypothetical protein
MTSTVVGETDDNDVDVGAVITATEEDNDRSPRLVIGTRYERYCQPTVLAISAGLNVPSFIFGMLGISPWCEYYSVWLIANGVMGLINVGAVIFSIVKLRQKMLQDCVGQIAHIQRQIERRQQLMQQQQQQQSDVESPSQEEDQQGDRRKIDTVEVVEETPKNGRDAANYATTTTEQQTVDDGKANCNGTSGAGSVVAETPATTTTTNSEATAIAAVSAAFETTTTIRGSEQISNVHSHPRHPSYHRRPSGFQVRVLSRRTQSSNRLRHLICYNAFISTYAIIFIFWVVWLANGAQLETMESNVEHESNVEDCEDYHRDFVTTSLTLGYVYVAVLVASILLSFCDRK